MGVRTVERFETFSIFSGTGPHPNPLPAGEGTGFLHFLAVSLQ
jgi:hypothetical protein